MVSSESLPDIQAQLNNATARLQPFQYLSQRGLYTALSLRQLGQELSQLEADIGVIHREQNSPQTQKLSKEVRAKNPSGPVSFKNGRSDAQQLFGNRLLSFVCSHTQVCVESLSCTDTHSLL